LEEKRKKKKEKRKERTMGVILLYERLSAATKGEWVACEGG